MSCSSLRHSRLPETWKFKDTWLLWLHKVKKKNRDNPHLYLQCLSNCFYLHHCFNFPLSTVGWDEQSFCPQTALAEALWSQGISLQVGREKAFFPSSLFWALSLLLFESCRCTPCLKRGWLWDSSGAAGQGDRSEVWTIPGTPCPGVGARLDYFFGSRGPQYTFLSPVQAGISIALSICVWAHVW